MGSKPEERYTMLRQAGLVTLIPFLLLVSPLVGSSRPLSVKAPYLVLWIVFLGLGFAGAERSG
jgi:hypothetical protein